MIIEIQHETRFEYSRPVAEWHSEFRMEPVSDATQSCQSFFLRVSQPAVPFRYRDGFGNSVHHFNLLAPEAEIRVLAAGVVDTHPTMPDLAGSTATLPIPGDGVPLETLDYLRPRGPAGRTPALEPVLSAIAPLPNERVVDFASRVTNYIFKHFQYAKAVTRSSSSIDDVLALGMGVCQDFAHLMIAILRCAGVPARYVSGYIHRANEESQSHAWVEVWIPDRGWVGWDPTNDTLIGERFVKVAVGRDFTDVSPNKGVYRGTGEEAIRVRVESRELERLPTLSWQEQLPPLHVPLVDVLTSVRPLGETERDEQQQQQQ